MNYVFCNTNSKSEFWLLLICFEIIQVAFIDVILFPLYYKLSYLNIIGDGVELGISIFLIF